MTPTSVGSAGLRPTLRNARDGRYPTEALRPSRGILGRESGRRTAYRCARSPLGDSWSDVTQMLSRSILSPRQPAQIAKHVRLSSREPQGVSVMPWGLTPAHLIIILVIVLIVVGPGKLPDTGAAIGKALRGFKDAVETGEVHPDAPPQTAQPMPPQYPAQPPYQPPYQQQPPQYPVQPPYQQPQYPPPPMPAQPPYQQPYGQQPYGQQPPQYPVQPPYPPPPIPAQPNVPPADQPAPPPGEPPQKG